MNWPTIVVLDTERIMKAFREHAMNTGKPHDLPDDIANEVVIAIKQRDRAHLRLDDLVLSMLIKDFHYPYGDFIDSTVASFTEELGRAVIQQLLKHRLYNRHGYLPYRHKTPRDPRFNCLILKRIDDGPTNPRVTWNQTTSHRGF